jgi:hypothetical protein
VPIRSAISSSQQLGSPTSKPASPHSGTKLQRR